MPAPFELEWGCDVEMRCHKPEAMAEYGEVD